MCEITRWCTKIVWLGMYVTGAAEEKNSPCMQVSVANFSQPSIFTRFSQLGLFSSFRFRLSRGHAFHGKQTRILRHSTFKAVLFKHLNGAHLQRSTRIFFSYPHLATPLRYTLPLHLPGHPPKGACLVCVFYHMVYMSFTPGSIHEGTSKRSGRVVGVLYLSSQC